MSKIISESGCKFGETCVFRHTEVDRQPSKKPKKSGGKGSVASFQNSKQLAELRIPGYRAAVIQVEFTEEHKILGIEAQRAFLHKVRHTS